MPLSPPRHHPSEFLYSSAYDIKLKSHSNSSEVSDAINTVSPADRSLVTVLLPGVAGVAAAAADAVCPTDAA